ncbi:BamA/TamA family outer membrane protein [Pleurocapsales cyanobacterium LEGE 10410]|nr:BamA/TamA family outer membrane protein [Pleurocapsales cyanobacterium LEGE 10410]
MLTAWLPIALGDTNKVAAFPVPSVTNPSIVQESDRPVDRRRRSPIPLEQIDRETVPVGNREVITDIVVRFVDENGNLTKGKTNPEVITREFDLQPGDAYDAELGKEGLQRVVDLTIIDRASLSLEPVTDNQAVLAIAVRESSNFFYGFGLTLPPPTALQGPVRPNTVNALSNSATGIAGGVRVGLRNLGGNNQQVSLGVEGGVEKFGFDLGYRRFLRHDRGIGVNLFNRRGVEPEFDEGERDLDLENNNDPWVHRLGGGIEYFQSIGEDFQGVIGVSYQRVSVRDGAFSDDLAARDELGNRLVVSDGGQDDLLTLNFAAFLDRRNDSENPTNGYQLKFGSDQYFSVGEADVLANRLAANYTHYLPFPLFGFSEGAKTLVFNVQGGTILGDAIPYDAFILGGSSSVRGYDTGEISTGRSFIQATAEYRYPIFGFNAFNQNIDVGGTLFIDYATDLGSADAVIGQPAVVRDQPGDGFGYGFGLRTLTPIGAVRTEFALNDEGDTKFVFTVGDRF